MNRLLSLPVQELICTSERVLVFATNHKGLPEDDFEGVWIGHEAVHEAVMVSSQN